MAQSDMTVDGFTFSNTEDAKLAKAELNRIAQLEGKINHKNPHLVSAVYEKAVANNLFKTPVGLCYLKSLQDELKNSPLIQNELSNITVASIITEEKVAKEVKKETKKAAKSKESVNKKSLYIIIGVLTGIIVILFAISFTAKNPNIINYEYNLQNKYAQWDEELNKREQIIREKEIELNIFNENE